MAETYTAEEIRKRVTTADVSKLTQEEFIWRGVCMLPGKKPDGKTPYLGCHVVYSGLNDAFRQKFDKDPIPVVNKMVEEGKLEKRGARGGPMIYLPGERPVSGATSGSAALKKMGV